MGAERIGIPLDSIRNTSKVCFKHFSSEDSIKHQVKSQVIVSQNTPMLENSMKMLPWGAKSIEEFLFYCCPECDEKYKDCQNFVDHAMQTHDSAKVSTLEASNIEMEDIPH